LQRIKAGYINEMFQCLYIAMKTDDRSDKRVIVRQQTGSDLQHITLQGGLIDMQLPERRHHSLMRFAVLAASDRNDARDDRPDEEQHDQEEFSRPI
jgi:hypothetical protein